MEIDQLLHDRIAALAKRKPQLAIAQLEIRASDCWDMDVSFAIAGQDGAFRIRNLRQDDVAALEEFGRRLGPGSKALFCPYPWDEPDKLAAAYESSIRQALRRIDASYLMEHQGGPIGHFFLWKAGGNPHSLRHGLELPELGVAIVDAWQGRGLGSLAVCVLKAVAESLGADGIELTTAMNNDSGWHAYRSAGFEHVGTLRIALGVDVTAAVEGQVTAKSYRDERQMVYCINLKRRGEILAYLASKRAGLNEERS